MAPGRQGPGQDRPGFVSRLDRDGDGKVSRKEFDGPPNAFDQLDADKDGYLSDSESPMRRGMGPPQGLRAGNRPRSK